MKDYKRQLEETLLFFINEREKYNIELNNCPDGSLGYFQTSRQQQFLWRVDGKRRGINKNPEMIQRLARKEFVNRVLHEIDTNINVITRAINDYRDINPKTIIEGMRNAYARLTPEMFLQSQERHQHQQQHLYQGQHPYLHQGQHPRPHPDRDSLLMTEEEDMAARLESHRVWAEQPYEKNDYPFGPNAQWTSRGLHVRSQKELTICEMIYKYEIPFRYDQVIHIGKNKLAPDFTFQQDNGEEMYLEYCGMMDDEEYVQSHLRKRKLYEQAGIYEWDNMIYIYTKGRQLNTQLVDSIIRYQILPRM